MELWLDSSYLMVTNDGAELIGLTKSPSARASCQHQVLLITLAKVTSD